MKHFQLNGQIREVGNKAVVKAIRKQGLVPCNLYGQGVGNILFTVEEKALNGILFTPASFIIDLVLSDGKKYEAVVHELQFHPVNEHCLHVDFLAVSESKPIAIDVPINITGHAAGVQKGGKFIQRERKLRISALMKDLPDDVTIDISPLEIGQNVVAGDLKYDNVTVLTRKDTIICSVRSTRNVAADDATAAAAASPTA